MSWSIEYTGSKEGVKAKVVEQMNKLAEQYGDKPEGDDIKSCRDRICALVDACDLEKDNYGTDWNAVKVSAGGSHGWTSKGLTTASFNVSVQRVYLAL